jgi:hypothetical protein
MGLSGVPKTAKGSSQQAKALSSQSPEGDGNSRASVKTGDLVSADVTKGKKVGLYTGRVAVRATGSFNICTVSGIVQSISYKTCRRLQAADGYGYQMLNSLNQ